jgi:hypothetical protein
VDLRDPTPRWVEVAYEISPRDRPGQRDTRYTRKLRARFEPLAGGRVRVTIPGRSLEQTLLAEDAPVPGSFSDFVWIFDARTGEVLSATLSGEMIRRLDWGLFESSARAKVEVEMGTQRAAGYEDSRRWLGQEFFEFCDDLERKGCHAVPARRYDAERGYVNAVGEVSVRYGEIVLRTFSPLGEAVLSEVETPQRMLPGAALAEQRLLAPRLLPAAATLPTQGFAPVPAVSAGPPASP